MIDFFSRPNLYLEVCMKSSSVENDLMRLMTKKDGKPCFSGPTIIYCPTKKASENVFQRLLGKFNNKSIPLILYLPSYNNCCLN